MSESQAITLREFNDRISSALNHASGLHDVWVVGETSDVRTSGGHCYLELIEKNPETGVPVARMRATIWASRYTYLANKFLRETGAAFASGIKVMLCVTASFHPVYGLSVNVADINPAYTLGDLQRRRMEMIRRLTDEGIINLNRELPWPDVPSRIAVISARGAAGYGDFINQLYHNRYRLRFSTTLFPAVMQGEGAPSSLLAALERIAARQEDFDGVVIIRGGGATGDLATFDHYELAAHIAMFPLPVIVGIGHERDITLLDYVANMRVKTPTAAAEWLIARGADALARLQKIAADIRLIVTERVALAHRRLEYCTGQLPLLVRARLDRAAMQVGPMLVRDISSLIRYKLDRRADHLRQAETLIDALSPQATLRRGFSITRVDGRAVTSPDDIPPGAQIVTSLAKGEFTSIKQS